MNGASPWARADVQRLVAVAGVGWVALMVGWVFTARRVAVDDQLPWLNVAVIGCLAAGMANATFLLRGYRAVRHRRRWVLTQPKSRRFVDGSVDESSRVRPIEAALVATAAMTRYHRADCPFVARKGDALVVLPSDEHRSAGRTPCPWCAP